MLPLSNTTTIPPRTAWIDAGYDGAAAHAPLLSDMGNEFRPNVHTPVNQHCVRRERLIGCSVHLLGLTVLLADCH
jgi:hypothetical protein